MLDAELRIAHQGEIDTLLLRARVDSLGNQPCCTSSALFICIVIAALFLGSEMNKDPSSLISAFFILAMLVLTAGLLCFLREIALATDTITLR
ncbi:MAG: DUF2721 domain-containing protein [Nitrosomonadales bacterium]